MLYNDIISLYHVDLNKLKRDYSKEPIIITPNGIGTEIPSKDEFYYLYIELNIPIKYLALLYGVKPHNISRWCHKLNIFKDKIMISKNIQKTLLDEYGVNAFAKSDVWKDRMVKTNLERYGVEFQVLSPTFNDKARKTKIERYGDENFNNRIKCRKTNLERYGAENITQVDTIREKMKHTCLERYGVEYYSKSKEWKEFMYLHKDEILDSQYKTMMTNSSFGKSKKEDEILKLLQKKFSIVETQYKSEQYPWKCDFYIPSKDMFIEYQGYPSHGFEPYIGSTEQLEKVKLWESKANNSVNSKYKDFIKTWTIRDVEKRQLAKDNNLNWLEFFSMEQFMEWYNKQ